MSAILTGLAMAAPGIIKGVRQLSSSAPQQKISNQTTSYLNKLRNISKEGLYGQDVKNEIGADLNQQSLNTRNAIRASATRQGLENSGVLAQNLLRQGGQSTLAAAKMAKQIAQMNEKSKLDASAESARVGDQIQQIKYQNALARQQRKDSAFSSFADAAGKGLTGFLGDKTDDIEEGLYDWWRNRNKRGNSNSIGSVKLPGIDL
tara:strand:- start:300 stop:914 length:615 start_codon:yes stop_codon:yes gene_type:complete